MDDVNPFLELQPVKFQMQEQKEERLGGVFVWIHEQCILQADHLHIYSQLPRSSQHILSSHHSGLTPKLYPFAEGLWPCPVRIHRHQERERFLHCVPCAQMDMALGLIQ